MAGPLGRFFCWLFPRKPLHLLDPVFRLFYACQSDRAIGTTPLGQQAGTVRPVPLGHLVLGAGFANWNNVVVLNARKKDRKTVNIFYFQSVIWADLGQESSYFRPVEDYSCSANLRTVPSAREIWY